MIEYFNKRLEQLKLTVKAGSYTWRCCKMKQRGNKLLDRLIHSLLLLIFTLLIILLGLTLDEREKQLKEVEKQSTQQQVTIKAQSRQIKQLQNAGIHLLGTDFEVTYYNACCITKSGRTVTDGVTVAVDTKVIPLGTWLRLTFADGTQYVRRADDTGGAVKGNIVDVYMDGTDEKLRELGRKRGVTVEIIEGL